MGGITFSCLGQPVETVAQFGVVFLIFAPGLEFSLAKLCGAKLSEGCIYGFIFVNVINSCGIPPDHTNYFEVVKFLVGKNGMNSLHGQITIGTLIFQAAGIVFIPPMASLLSWSFVPRFLKWLIRLSSQTNELYQLAAVAICLLSAWCSDKLGLSLELGSFMAGVMISTSDFAQHTLDQVEPIRNLFAALFLSSIGVLIHVHFLWSHVDMLLAFVVLVVFVKTTVKEKKR